LGIVYGLSRKQCLDLPSWEFRVKLEYAQKHQARQMLDLYQVVSVGQWGDKEGRKDYVDSMKMKAGYSPERKAIVLPTQAELRKKMDQAYSVIGIPTVDHVVEVRGL
jgi:hypothetical protein